ncbi:MAG: class I SAM-dependent methyltransferase, partial [Candidatus Izemoplasmatales bacterium]
GSSGKVFAADIHPLASEKVRKRTEKSEINNIETIVTDCNIDLEDQSIDKVVLIDVLHNLSNYEANIKEFHRLLKDDGKLWVDDHHYDEEEIRVKITKNNLFKYESKVDSLFEFEKNSKV